MRVDRLDIDARRAAPVVEEGTGGVVSLALAHGVEASSEDHDEIPASSPRSDPKKYSPVGTMRHSITRR